MKIDRMLRVNSMIRQLLGESIEKDLKGLLPALTTVTVVKTSPDLAQANVYVSVYGGEERQREALDVLASHRRKFQSEIAHSIKIKRTPILHFFLDHTLEKADRVENIIGELHLADVGPAEMDEPGTEAPATSRDPDRE